MELDEIKAEICAVTKQHSIPEINKMLARYPHIKIIAENRWPDCLEAFETFTHLKRHFIGPLQKNKVKKVLPLIDCIQSVDSISLLEKLQKTCSELNKDLDFCFQVNISKDPKKAGIEAEAVTSHIQTYLDGKFSHLNLIGLMTIGSQSSMEEREKYFKDFKKLFDQINKTHFPAKPLTTLSMGMSEDYKLAIDCGATTVRLGRILFNAL
jgi:PLP dependent protein